MRAARPRYFCGPFMHDTSVILGSLLQLVLATGTWPVQPVVRSTQPAVAPAELTIAVEDASDPWSRADGTGYANDVVTAAFAAAGIRVKQLVVPYARCRAMVMEGAVVACFSMSRAPDLGARVRFPSMPLFVCQSVLVHNVKRPLPATQLRDLPRGTTVGVVLGYEYPAQVEQARLRGIELQRVTSETLLLRMVATGRVQSAIVNINDSKPLALLMALAGVADGVAVVTGIGELDSYLGFSAQHPQGAMAMQQYESGMRTIRRNGMLARIERAWADSSRVSASRARAAMSRRR
jgi:hypothetical protein